MQDAPDVDLVRHVEVEDGERVAVESDVSESGDAELEAESGCVGVRAAPDAGQGALDAVDEAAGDVGAGVVPVVVEGGVDVSDGSTAVGSAWSRGLVS